MDIFTALGMIHWIKGCLKPGPTCSSAPLIMTPQTFILTPHPAWSHLFIITHIRKSCKMYEMFLDGRNRFKLLSTSSWPYLTDQAITHQFSAIHNRRLSYLMSLRNSQIAATPFLFPVLSFHCHHHLKWAPHKPRSIAGYREVTRPSCSWLLHHRLQIQKKKLLKEKGP